MQVSVILLQNLNIVDICSRYVLGVYDKKTEVMKMYDTEMITLQPQILGNYLWTPFVPVVSDLLLLFIFIVWISSTTIYLSWVDTSSTSH